MSVQKAEEEKVASEAAKAAVSESLTEISVESPIPDKARVLETVQSAILQDKKPVVDAASKLQIDEVRNSQLQY